MAKKLNIEEGDMLTIKVRVRRISEDGEKVTIAVWGQPFTGSVEYLDIVKHEKGSTWPTYP